MAKGGQTWLFLKKSQTWPKMPKKTTKKGHISSFVHLWPIFCGINGHPCFKDKHWLPLVAVVGEAPKDLSPFWVFTLLGHFGALNWRILILCSCCLCRWIVVFVLPRVFLAARLLRRYRAAFPLAQKLLQWLFLNFFLKN